MASPKAASRDKRGSVDNGLGRLSGNRQSAARADRPVASTVAAQAGNPCPGRAVAARMANHLPTLSILDLATVRRGQPTGEALAESLTLAQTAERTGAFERIWFAEHHNMPTIASSATAVLLAHIAAHTERIRLGSGGIMLPNHSPLVIAEQFGTLAELHPGRIDLGLGRAPGTDQRTVLALRRDPAASDRFPDDILELQGYLSDESLIPGIVAHPGQGTKVPLYILGSSLYGAHLAAQLGLPYAFASHFAPDQLKAAVAVYRSEFQPSSQLERPHVIAALNVIASDDREHAERLKQTMLVERVRAFASRQRPVTDDDMPALLASPLADQVLHMARHTAAGDAERVGAQLAEFAEYADADELMMTNPAASLQDRLRTLELVATL